MALVALSLASGIGPKLQSALLEQFDTAQNVLSQPKDVLLTVNGIGPKTATSIIDPGLRDEARKLLLECHALQVDVLDQRHGEYPQRLREICDPPTVLYRKGVLLTQDDLAIGIVGSRRCTAYGRRQAERMAAALSRAGFTIVSGLARGIDAAAHRGALKSGGRTLAILRAA